MADIVVRVGEMTALVAEKLSRLKRAFLDALFPLRCVGCGREGVVVCAECLSAIRLMPLNLCPSCGRAAPAGRTHPRCQGECPLDALISPYHYANPVLRDLIKDFKYHGAAEIEKVLAGLAAAGVRALSTQFPADAVVVPIPLHPSRERQRGFNQAERIGQAVASALGSEIAEPLSRIRRTAEQARLEISLRRKNCLNAFRADSVEGDFILVDDVVTSGETMKAAAQALKDAGARSVIGFALAHGQGDRLGR
jgi:ComF family protein